MSELNREELIQQGIKARDNGYAPYSNHPVGAVVITKDGRSFAGCNVENAAFPLGNCAESVAIGNMVMDGGGAIDEVIVVGPGDHLCTPCGGCRQRIREFATTDTKVTVCGSKGEILLETTLKELLPYDFGPDNVRETLRK